MCTETTCFAASGAHRQARCSPRVHNTTRLLHWQWRDVFCAESMNLIDQSTWLFESGRLDDEVSRLRSVRPRSCGSVKCRVIGTSRRPRLTRGLLGSCRPTVMVERLCSKVNRVSQCRSFQLGFGRDGVSGRRDRERHAGGRPENVNHQVSGDSFSGLRRRLVVSPDADRRWSSPR